MYLIDLFSLGLMYVKKFTSFCQVLKKHAHEGKLVSFCLSVDAARGMFHIISLSVST